MTNKQFEIFKAVINCRTLPEILAATGLADHDALQDEAGVDNLDFSDWNMDENTVVTLTNEAMDRYEKRQLDSRKEFRAWFTLGIALWGAFTGTIALFLK
nr:MAG TPA: transmemb Cytochrome C oxidase subunit II, transmembrane [Caudoviricetes sp.]